MAAPKKAVGPKSDKMWRDALMVAVKRLTDDGTKTKKLYLLADALINKALAGDVSAMREIGDRLDGKPAQAVELGGPDGGPIEVIDLSPMKAALLILATLREAEEATDSRISQFGPVLAHSANSLEFNDTGAVPSPAGDRGSVE